MLTNFFLLLGVIPLVVTNPNRFPELQQIVETTLALGRRYFTGCSVLMYSNAQEQLYGPGLQFNKMLLTNLNHQGCIAAKSIHAYKEYRYSETTQGRCPRIMNIFYGNHTQFKEPFAKLSREVLMAGPLWLIYLPPEVSIPEFFENANVPFDVDMLAAKRYVNETVIIWEIHRVSMSHHIRWVPFGFWSERTGLIADNHVSLYYRRTDFEGIVLKVGTTSTYPLVTITIDKNGKKDMEGYFATVWKDLEVRLNFSSEYYEPADKTTGILRNGAWTGVIGMVVRGDVDVGVGSFTISPQRSQDVDFLRPILSTRNQLFFKKPSPLINWNTIFQPFHTYVWIALLLWIITAGFFLHVICQRTAYFRSEYWLLYDSFSLVDSLFCALRAFTQQGSPFVPNSFSSRILFASSYLAGVIMTTAYSGVLISFIAVHTPWPPFNSLRQLLNEGSYSLTLVKDSASHMFFSDATDPVVQKIYVEMIAQHPEDQLARNTEDGLNKVCKGNHVVYFGPEAAAEVIANDLNQQGCDITTLQEGLNRIYQSIAIVEDNQYKDALNHHLDMMKYQGILGRMRKQFWPDLQPLLPSTVIQVSLEQVVQIHVILLLGFILGCIILGMEIMYYKRFL